ADVVRGLPQPLQRDQMKQVYARVMALQAARYGKTRFGDKTPSHSAHLKRLFEDFPGARVVRITRDPRAVVRSLVRMPWAVSSRLAASFLVEVESRHVEPFYDHMLNIRFEDLLAKPHGVMMQVLDYVGEPWDNAVLNHHLHLPDDTPPMPWFQRAEQARESFRPIDWSTHDPVEVRLLEWLTRRTMRLSNYHRAQLPTRVSRLRLFGRWLSELPAFGRSAMRVIRLARLLRNPMWDCTQEGMAMVKALNPAAWDAYPGFEWPDAPSLSEGWEQSLSDR
ncbi:MAG: sulfotransferase, partial [Myxococcota bacterium]